jgi:prepilin-type N-terminal cleavage/methylation domain-containing protein
MKKLRLSSTARRTFRGRSRGFTMLEVVIAIALLGIIAISILTSLSAASAALIIADRRATAESLARTQMEYVKHSDYDNDLAEDHPEYSLDPQIQTTLPPNFSVVTTAVRLDHDENPNDDDGIQLITVTVTYYILGAENKELERQFILEDYKIE